MFFGFKKNLFLLTLVLFFCCVSTVSFTQGNANMQLDDIRLIGGDGSATVYEDAEDGSIHRWIREATTPTTIPDGEIYNIYGWERGSRIIELYDKGTNTTFCLGNGNSSTYIGYALWENTSQFTIEWSMNFKVNFSILVLVRTDAGYKFLYYTPINYDHGYLNWGSGWVHHGLGSYVITNGWITITRDLQADLSDYLPGVTITSVLSMKVRGIGDYAVPEPPSADAHTIGFWKNNIAKALENKVTGIQVDKETLEGYLEKVGQFYLAPFEDITLESAYAVLSSTSSDAVDLLKKQLLAAELSFFNGARLPGGTNLTMQFLEQGEEMIVNPAGTRDAILALKDKYDVFNNNEIVED